MQAWKAFLAPKLHHVSELLVFQGITTTARLLFGFLCVRLLPISEYARFAVVFGFLGTMAVLLDISFSGTLMPLIGEHIDDCQLIADYVASLRQLAHRLYLFLAPVAVLLYPVFVRKERWSWRVIAVMLAILLVVSWFDRVSGAYGAVLIVRRDRRAWYRVQMTASLGTLVLLGTVWAFHGLNAFSAILISAAGSLYICLSYYRRASHLLGVTGRPSREKRHAIVHMALPNIPGVIFYALQGQIALLLITVFGHTTAVASVGALGRLGQIFVLLAQINPLLVEPYFARLSAQKFKRNYIAVLLVEGGICLIFTAVAGYFPQFFLWILGPKYSQLHYEVLLMIAGSSVGFLAGLLWVIHWSRRFIYWWNSMITIALTLAVQAWFIWKVDLSTVRAVLMLSLASSCVNLLVNALTGIYGFIFGPRKTAGLVPVPAGENLV